MQILVILVLYASAALAQSVYPFSVDQDAVSGAPDFSYLNQPIEPAGRVFVREGRFFTVGEDLTPNTPDDRRIRFFGVNTVFSACFPTEADAVRIAKRLRRLGVNLIRLHHMDTSPDATPSNAASILTTGPYPTLNTHSIPRLRRFLDALKAEGIYINLNLHVGYTFRPAVDGIPSVASFPTQTKPLRLFYPPMIERQAKFTRELIDALGLKDDPVLAMVEISNETSLIYHWQNGSLDRYMEGEYRDALATPWNDWLRSRYADGDALRSAWGATEPDGADILPGQWRVESRTPAAIQSDGEILRIDAAQASSAVIVKQVGFSVEASRPYIAEIDMRADLPSGATRNIYWDVKQDVSPWRTASGQTVQVSSEWRRYRMTLTPQFGMENIGRFAISVENVGTPVYVRSWRLYTAGKRALGDGESPEAGTVAIVTQNEFGTEARTNDYLLFLADRDRAYLNTMLDAVREKTDSLVPVAGTQVGFGGLMNFDSHRDLDYQDNHYYVDHYNFPNVSWDGRDWRMRDTSHTGSGASSFLNMAVARQAGRPYTVSEFNQPWPNTHAAECDPTLAVFARFQDWDGIMHFAYSHGRGWDDGVPNGFNLNGDWTKWVNFGQSAWLFRSGAIRDGLEPVDIPVTVATRLQATREKRNGSLNAFFANVYGYTAATPFTHPVRLAIDSDAQPTDALALKPEPPYRSDTGEFTYDPSAKVWLIHAPMAAGVFGQPGSAPLRAGPLEVQLAASARGVISLLVTSLDGQPIESSARLLLTNPGYSLRSQPGVSPARPQAIVNYGTAKDWWTLEPDPRQPSKPSGDLNGGSRPTWMERVEAKVKLSVAAARIDVFPLDGKGQRLPALDARFVEPVEGGYRLWLQADGQDPAPWYEIAIER